MLEQKGGTIVNVSSIATRGINRVPYAAAKGGVNALTASLAFEYAEQGIRVCGIAPGGTEAPPRKVPRNLAAPAEKSPQEQAWWREVEEQTKASSLLKRYGTLEEQAAAILFFASDEASYITGVILPVGGGDLG
jgi:dihydroxycyclohexadiene carboxylate dehydrogenase